MYHNSHFDKAHKAVFAPACMCVYDRACLSRCAAGHAECIPMFISKYHGQACRTAWWENGITAICSSAACCAPSLWVLQLHISISHAHAACHLAICRGIWPSEEVAHVTKGSCRSSWNVCLFSDSFNIFIHYGSEDKQDPTSLTLLWLLGLQSSGLFWALCLSWDHGAQLCVLPAVTCWMASREAGVRQFIIVLHKQPLMLMTGVVTCLRQHYVCFTRPLSSQVLQPWHWKAARGCLAARPSGSGMLLKHTRK